MINSIDEKEHIINVLTKVERECGKIMLSAKNDLMAIDTKSNFRDVVTKYDKEIQASAIKEILLEFPDAHFIGEEEGMNTFSKDGLTFIIDPIDGTLNFTHNANHSCISIGCVKGGEPIVGVIYNPYVDEMFTAKKGEGAFLNGKQIHVSNESIKNSLVIFGAAPYNPETFDDTTKRVRHILEYCQDVRHFGSCVLDLCDVAMGCAGIFFEAATCVWDYAAGALLVEEAGGICVTYDNKPLPFDGRKEKSSIIAGSKKIIEESELLNM